MSEALKVSWVGAALLVLVASGCHAQPPTKTTSAPDACVFGRPIACKAACERNDAKSCAIWGAMLAVGRGVAPDRARGEDLLRQACAAGAARGCAGAALVLVARTQDDMNAGVPISQADRRSRAREASKLMAQACSLGERIACKQVEEHPDEPTEKMSGAELCDGARLPRLEQACMSGPASAQRAGCGMATLCHFSGDAGVKNPVKAAQFASRGCAVNDAVSCKILGLQKIEGVGTPKDVEGGLQAILKACHLGDEEACEAIKSLSRP